MNVFRWGLLRQRIKTKGICITNKSVKISPIKRQSSLHRFCVQKRILSELSIFEITNQSRVYDHGLCDNSHSSDKKVYRHYYLLPILTRMLVGDYPIDRRVCRSVTLLFFLGERSSLYHTCNCCPAISAVWVQSCKKIRTTQLRTLTEFGSESTTLYHRQLFTFLDSQNTDM